MTTTEKPQDPAMPLVNLNGTDIEDLIVQTLSVHRAAGKLMDVLRAAAPHGRDYPHVEGFSILDAAQIDYQYAVQGARDAHQWAEKRLYDLSRQNMARNDGSKAAQVILSAERRVDEIMGRKRGDG
jgi:hypothetical protein